MLYDSKTGKSSKEKQRRVEEFEIYKIMFKISWTDMVSDKKCRQKIFMEKEQKKKKCVN